MNIWCWIIIVVLSLIILAMVTMRNFSFTRRERPAPEPRATIPADRPRATESNSKISSWAGIAIVLAVLTLILLYWLNSRALFTMLGLMFILLSFGLFAIRATKRSDDEDKVFYWVLAVLVPIVIGTLWFGTLEGSENIRNIFASAGSSSTTVTTTMMPAPVVTTPTTPATANIIPCRNPMEDGTLVATPAGSDTVEVGSGCPWKIYPDRWLDHTITTMNQFKEVTSVTHRTRNGGGLQQRDGVIVRFVTVNLDEPDTVRFTVERRPKT